jgi:hypothetical protein
METIPGIDIGSAAESGTIMRTSDVLHRHRWRLVIVLLVGLAAALTMYVGLPAIIAIISFPRYPSCDDRVIREFPSPNGRSVALVLRTNCGATTPFVSSVAIKVFGELDLKRDTLFSIKGEGNDIEVIWDGNFAPTIVYDKPELIYTQVTVWRTERISYRQR